MTVYYGTLISKALLLTRTNTKLADQRTILSLTLSKEQLWPMSLVLVLPIVTIT